jgi:hypothetical protein
MTFVEIGGLVGELPQSATDDRPWWGNERGHLQADAWLDAGYEVAEVDQGLGIVRFRRRVFDPVRQAEVGAEQEPDDLLKAPSTTGQRPRSTFGENLRENLQHAATQISGAAQRAAQTWRASRAISSAHAWRIAPAAMYLLDESSPQLRSCRLPTHGGSPDRCR